MLSWLINGAMDTFYNAIVSVSNYYNQVVLGNDTNIFGSNGTSTASMDASMMPEMIPTIVELAHAYQPSIIQDVGFVENKVRPTSHKCYDRNLGVWNHSALKLTVLGSRTSSSCRHPSIPKFS